MKDNFRILLVIPDNPETARFQMKTSGITPPLGIGYLASYLLREGISVSVLDNSVEHLGKDGFLSRIKEIGPHAVGFTALTYAVPNAFRMAGVVKSHDPRITVIMGGNHSSALPLDTAAHNDVDIVVKGEGEDTLLELARALPGVKRLKDIKGIIYKEDGRIIANDERPLIKDINAIPVPAYDLLPMDKYFLASSRRHTDKRVGSIVTMRGCPYSCSFCSKVVFGSNVRYREPGSVINELELLNKKYGVGELVFWDDNFNMLPERALEICRLIRKNNLKITWSCNNRADLFTAELCSALYDSGCRQVNFGIESGVQCVRNNVKKDIDPVQIEKAVRLCRKHKLLVSCSFIFGLPGETRETALSSLKLAKELDPDYVMFCALVPMPGSKLFDVAVGSGTLDKNAQDWERYVTLLSDSHPILSMSALGVEELVKFQKKVYREFYFRPRYVYRTLRKIRSFENLRQAFRGLNAILSHQIAKIHD